MIAIEKGLFDKIKKGAGISVQGAAGLGIAKYLYDEIKRGIERNKTDGLKNLNEVLTEEYNYNKKRCYITRKENRYRRYNLIMLNEHEAEYFADKVQGAFVLFKSSGAGKTYSSSDGLSNKFINILNRNESVICLDPTYFEHLTKEQIRLVIDHEIGHIIFDDIENAIENNENRFRHIGCRLSIDIGKKEMDEIREEYEGLVDTAKRALKMIPAPSKHDRLVIEVVADAYCIFFNEFDRKGFVDSINGFDIAMISKDSKIMDKLSFLYNYWNRIEDSSIYYRSKMVCAYLKNTKYLQYY